MYRKGLTLVDLILVIVILLILLAVILPAMDHGNHPRRRSICSSNIKQIFNALATYGNECGGAFPQVLPGSIIGEDKAEKNLKPGLPEDPFKDFPAGTNHSVSENMWLLCREGAVQPEIFICPTVFKKDFKINLKDGPNGGAEYFVDFPWSDSGVTISYSFVQPWSRFKEKGKGSWDMWSENVDPRFVLGADANNSSQPDFKSENIRLTYEEMKKYVNSTNHTGEGQNVLYGDGHVAWSDSSYVGIDEDNIYTAISSGFTGKAGDIPGILSVRPWNENDTVLIPNKDADLAKWNRKP